VLASRPEGGLGDRYRGASGHDLLDAAVRAVQFGAESKLLDPAFGHDTP